MNFEKSAAVSSAVFDSSSEEESQELFKQYIADNFDHNEDTTTGDNTTHVMGIISCDTPKSEYMKSQPIKRTKMLSGEMMDVVKLNHLLRTYEKPNVSKFKKIKLKKIVPFNLNIKTFQKLDTFWHLSALFMENTPNWQGFMSSIIHGNHYLSHIVSSYDPNKSFVIRSSI